MTPETLEAFYSERGYKKNRYGKWMSPTGNKRACIMTRVLRVECKLTYVDGSHEWVRLRSAYLGTLRVTGEGRLAGKWIF